MSILKPGRALVALGATLGLTLGLSNCGVLQDDSIIVHATLTVIATRSGAPLEGAVMSGDACRFSPPNNKCVERTHVDFWRETDEDGRASIPYNERIGSNDTLRFDVRVTHGGTQIVRQALWITYPEAAAVASGGEATITREVHADW